MMTGRLPFEAKSKIRLVLKHIEEEPPLPTDIDSKLNLKLETICMRALQKPREARYQTAREMRADVRAVLGESRAVPIASIPPPRREKRMGSEPPPRTGSRDRTPQSEPPPPMRSSRPRQPVLDLAPTTTIQYPNETTEAIAEARKRLGNASAAPPARMAPSTPMTPIVASSATTTDPPRAREGALVRKIALGVALLVGLAIAVWLAMR